MVPWSTRRSRRRRSRQRFNEALRKLGAYMLPRERGEWSLRRRGRWVPKPKTYGHDNVFEALEREKNRHDRLERTARRYRKLERAAKRRGMCFEEYVLWRASQER